MYCIYDRDFLITVINIIHVIEKPHMLKYNICVFKFLSKTDLKNLGSQDFIKNNKKYILKIYFDINGIIIHPGKKYQYLQKRRRRGVKCTLSL